ncbi:hypothetical protein EV193_101751 [Herbihabitans rhizosphaerae]|uniref:Uncharacterized protein n=2 Tax=Herbihabitans rhizosphaerae TaxID=1872711 RepID=A0A4Q7L891_9PSEU|nr:hypothetical protein EV193_101751 [Herbihabitans rhizosphaerae]
MVQRSRSVLAMYAVAGGLMLVGVGVAAATMLDETPQARAGTPVAPLPPAPPPVPVSVVAPIPPKELNPAPQGRPFIGPIAVTTAPPRPVPAVNAAPPAPPVKAVPAPAVKPAPVAVLAAAKPAPVVTKPAPAVKAQSVKAQPVKALAAGPSATSSATVKVSGGGTGTVTVNGVSMTIGSGKPITLPACNPKRDQRINLPLCDNVPPLKPLPVKPIKPVKPVQPIKPAKPAKPTCKAYLPVCGYEKPVPLPIPTVDPEKKIREIADRVVKHVTELVKKNPELTKKVEQRLEKALDKVVSDVKPSNKKQAKKSGKHKSCDLPHPGTGMPI